MYDYTPREDYFPKMVNGQIEVGMTLSEVQVVISCTYPRKLKEDPNSRLILGSGVLWLREVKKALARKNAQPQPGVFLERNARCVEGGLITSTLGWVLEK